MRFAGLFIALSLFFSAASCNAAAGSVTKAVEYTVDQSRTAGTIGFTIRKVEFRDDVTRVYGSLIGIPHTSGRIDSMSLQTDGNTPVIWTDIDGIDMKRWFQWEDEGTIDVEIDFPVMSPARSLIFRLSGPKGESVWVVNEK